MAPDTAAQPYNQLKAGTVNNADVDELRMDESETCRRSISNPTGGWGGPFITMLLIPFPSRTVLSRSSPVAVISGVGICKAWAEDSGITRRMFITTNTNIITAKTSFIVTCNFFFIL
jgi:hypothetical protein